MTLLGVGLIFLRHSVPEGDSAVAAWSGTVVLMPGLGFIISAGITWVLARHLGLMPDSGGRALKSICCLSLLSEPPQQPERLLGCSGMQP